MQLVAGGPEIPNAVLEAHEAGRLAFICGAGVSYPNGLPLFGGLVCKVRDGLGAAGKADVRADIDAFEYDRALSHLVGHYGEAAVRHEVQAILKAPTSTDVATHSALLDLSTNSKGSLQIVTTNFDLLFEEADPDVRACAAPTLPVPKPGKWHALVYLHGRIDDTDPDGQHLVLTTGDFGTAYLVERWASRFVSELFAHFDVIFVGYSVSDPVMRYLMDAVASDRALGLHEHEAYAFVPKKGKDDLEQLEAEWKGKNVVPIPYGVKTTAEGGEDHSLLHSTLHEWAKLWKGGLVSRKNVVFDSGRKNPGGLSPEERSRLLWALKELSAAAHFRELGHEAPLDWIDVFLENEYLKRADEYAAGPNRVQDPVELVDAGYRTQDPPPLGPITNQIAVWLTAHIHDRRLIQWVISKGGWLHPQVAEYVSRELERRRGGTGIKVDPAVERVWHLLLDQDVLERPDNWSLRYWSLAQHVKVDPWTPKLRGDLLRALAPTVRVNRPFNPELWGLSGAELADDGASLRVSDLAYADGSVRAGRAAQDIVEAIWARDDREAVLADIAFEATALLHQALDLFAVVDQAGVDHDPSTVEQPSIEPHDQNHHHEAWTWLIELVRSTFDAVLTVDTQRAERILAEWGRIPYPLFRRLTLYGLKKMMEQ